MSPNLSLTAMDPADRITVGMASVFSRCKGMIRVLESLLPACDHFDLYLNDYPIGFQLPIFNDEKLTVYRAPPDLGARGKLYMAHRTPGYWLTVDDDLIYPADYTYKMVQAIEKYQRQAIVGVHGALFVKPPDPMQPQTRVLFSHAARLEHDLPVHMLGTGIMAYHSDTIMLDWRPMEPGKIDEQVAVVAQESRVPMLCVAHPDDWVVEDDNLKYRDALRRDRQASEAAVKRQQRPWDLFLPPSWKEYQRFP